MGRRIPRIYFQFVQLTRRATAELQRVCKLPAKPLESQETWKQVLTASACVWTYPFEQLGGFQEAISHSLVFCNMAIMEREPKNSTQTISTWTSIHLVLVPVL